MLERLKYQMGLRKFTKLSKIMIDLCTGLNSVSQKTHTFPETQDMILFGNGSLQVFVISLDEVILD